MAYKSGRIRQRTNNVGMNRYGNELGQVTKVDVSLRQ